MPVTQLLPPPVSAESPSQVSEPGSPLAGHGVEPPEMLAGFRIVAFDEAAMAVFRAGHADDHDAVGDQRRARHGIAVLDRRRLRRLDVPELLAGLGVQRDDVVVEQRPDDLAVVDRGAAIDDAAADDAQGLGRIFVIDAPELLAGHRVDRNRRVVRRDVDDAVLDEREALRAAVVGDRKGPFRDQLLTLSLLIWVSGLYRLPE